MSPDTGTGAPADCSHNYQIKMKTTTRGESPLSATPCSVSLVVGRVYRAKKPKGCGFPPLCDDRQIKWIGGDQVQYDSPSVKNGRKYPTITLAKFEAWVARDVTDELPDGEWANYPPNADVEAPPPLKSGCAETEKLMGGCSRTPCCASLIVHDPADLPKCDGEILVALWGANEWEIVNVRENVGGPFTAEYKSTGELADPSEWQWWADLHCMILHND